MTHETPEHMIDSIEAAMDSVHDIDVTLRDYASAVAAALPDMVMPLVWRNSYGVWRAESPLGDYKVTGRILSLPLPMNPQQVHLDTQAAQAAANAHHRAQIMAALGLTL